MLPGLSDTKSRAPAPCVDGAENVNPVPAAPSKASCTSPTAAFVIVTVFVAPPVLKSPNAPIADRVAVATSSAVSFVTISTSIPVLPPVSALPAIPGSVPPELTSYQT